MTLIVPYNKTYQKQNKNLVPYSFRKAIISAINLKNATVDISFVGNSQTVVKSVSIASNVNIYKMNVGDKCKVDIFDPSNPNDMVVSYTYGNNNSYAFATGTATIAQAVQSVIPHGLGITPNFISTICTVAPADGANTVAVWQSREPDAVNIYLTGYYGPVDIRWYAAKF